ncbi:MAG: dipeptide ABC transporter ATP-binding protein [Gammaproteobacteria bacterium]
MNDELLRVQDLQIAFSKERNWLPVVKNINFTIHAGETVALVGESGSGKTLTALAIMQLLPETARVHVASHIWLKGQDILQLPEVAMRKVRGKRIGLIFQDAMTALNPVLTIGEQIDEVLRSHSRLSRNMRKKQLLAWLTEVGIDQPERVAASYSHQLSGGMRQRALIAMMLAAEPELLIADEPTSALDVTLAAQILQLLKSLKTKLGMSLLLITHDLGIVAQIADQVIVMHEGKLVEQTPASIFFRQPTQEYSRHLLASLPNWQNRQRPIEPVSTITPILNVEDLRVYFPVRKGLWQRTVGYLKAVDNVDFSLRPGRTLALIGESGSGKTTVGRSIVRLLKPTGGRILFEGRDLAVISNARFRKLRQDLQIVFQDPYAAINPRMLVGEIIAEGLVAYGLKLTREQRETRIAELLQLVGLTTDSQWQYPHEFSGGQRQRICIARSLALQPKVIICDEPTSALDATVQMQVLRLLEKLQIELGLSYLLITHNFAVVAYLADEVAVMREGKIVEQGEVQQILNNPAHPYTQHLLACVPKVPTL